MFSDTVAPYTPLEGERIQFTLVLANVGNTLVHVLSVIDTYTTGGVTGVNEISGMCLR